MVIGMKNDETVGRIMCKAIGLRVKMYSFKVCDPATVRFKTPEKAMGVQKAFMETDTYEQYLEQLHKPEENPVTVRKTKTVHMDT